MKPDFSQMTRTELKQYVRNHHEDDEAIRALFSRDSDNAIFFPMPKTPQEATEIENFLRAKIAKQKSSN